MILYGNGGLGREVAAEMRSRAFPISCVDDDTSPPEQWPPRSLFVVAVGDGRVRRRMVERALHAGHVLSAFVSPRAFAREVEPTEGVLVLQGACLTTDIRVGRGVLVNQGATIGHDCVLGDWCSIQPGANLTGRVHVRNHAYVGIGATVICTSSTRPLVIGENAVIGGGAVVLHDVPPNATVVGNPARPIVRAATG